MIFNRQAAVRVPVLALKRFFARVRRKLRIPADAIAVCFVTNAQIARWNREFRKKRGPTDVLSFPAERPDADDKKRIAQRRPRSRKSINSGKSVLSSASPSCYLGDIAIAPAVARANARRLGRTLTDELRILILHGVIHLLGYDHETDHGEMDRLEQSLRRSLGL